MDIKIFSYNVHGLPFILESWTQPLAEWFHGCDYDFVCLQEVFTEGRIGFLTEALEANGYTVIKPHDVVHLFGSGLLTAVRSSDWIVLGSEFRGFDDSIGAETLVNKGFHWLNLKHRSSGTELQIVNTHLQADHPINYVFTNFSGFHEIRLKQSNQIMDFLTTKPVVRTLIIGDINAELEPHPEMVYLTGSKDGIKKHTFESTGEDLDHVVLLPSRWVGRLPIVKEIAVLCKLWWSDHWPLHVLLRCETS
jgi:endonuclease/exonuclease/phosphatase family metal-dependent hydrolase